MADTVEVSLGLGGLVPGVEWGTAPHIILEALNPFSLALLWFLAVGVKEVFQRASGWPIAGTFWGLATLLSVVFQLIGSWFSGNL